MNPTNTVNNAQRNTTYRLTGYLMVAIASILFGFNGSLSRILFDGGVTPVTLVEFRMLIGGLSLLVVLLVGWRKGLKLHYRNWGWVIGFGLSLALVTYTYFVAISRLPVAVALVIQFSAIAWLNLGDAIWRRQMPSTYILLALLLTFGGIILLTGVWRQNLNGLDSVGLLYAAFSVVAYTAYLLFGRRVGREVPSPTSNLYGALVASVFWLCAQPPWSIPVNTWEPHRLLLIFVVGIFGMAIPFTLLLTALRRIDAPRVSIVTMLELVAGGIIAYFWLGQRLDLWQISGCALVLVGITILQYEQVSG